MPTNVEGKATGASAGISEDEDLFAQFYEEGGTARHQLLAASKKKGIYAKSVRVREVHTDFRATVPLPGINEKPALATLGRSEKGVATRFDRWSTTGFMSYSPTEIRRRVQHTEDMMREADSTLFNRHGKPALLVFLERYVYEEMRKLGYANGMPTGVGEEGRSTHSSLFTHCALTAH